MIVFIQFQFALFRCYNPYANSLQNNHSVRTRFSPNWISKNTTYMIITARCKQWRILIDSNHPNPFAMADKRSHAVSASDFPHFDQLITWRRYQIVARRSKYHRRDVVIVTVQRFDAVVSWRWKIPQFYSHVRRAWCWNWVNWLHSTFSIWQTEKFAGRIETNILHRIGMSFQRPFEFARLVIPYLAKFVVKNHHLIMNSTLIVASSLDDAIML